MKSVIFSESIIEYSKIQACILEYQPCNTVPTSSYLLSLTHIHTHTYIYIYIYIYIYMSSLCVYKEFKKVKAKHSDNLTIVNTVDITVI